MAEGAADATTINFVCNIIGISQSSIMKLAPDALLTNYGIIYGD